MSRFQTRYDLRWSRENLCALLAVCLLALGALVGRRAHRPVRIGERVPVNRRRLEAGVTRMDPNLADAASLCCLPGIGPARAKAILAYRKAYGPRAFRSPEDLTAVKGIGPATVEKLAPHLALPAPAPPATSRPRPNPAVSPAA